MNEQRGAIYHEQAYALGKMLDHSGWTLPRLITPSDIDMVLDNDGYIIFCELSSGQTEWKQLKSGQSRLYRNVIKNTHHCSALLKHSIQLSDRRQINTLTDIESFQLMFHDTDPFDKNGTYFVMPILEGTLWPRFVERWFENPNQEREFAIEYRHRNLNGGGSE